MTMDEMRRAGKGEIVVLVDTDTSRQNVSRAAASQGWQVKSVESEGTGYRITIAKD
jgi:TusA-related sulfurtransferase